MGVFFLLFKLKSVLSNDIPLLLSDMIFCVVFDFFYGFVHGHSWKLQSHICCSSLHLSKDFLVGNFCWCHRCRWSSSYPLLDCQLEMFSMLWFKMIDHAHHPTWIFFVRPSRVCIALVLEQFLIHVEFGWKWIFWWVFCSYVLFMSSDVESYFFKLFLLNMLSK